LDLKIAPIWERCIVAENAADGGRRPDPADAPWEAVALPLNYTRIVAEIGLRPPSRQNAFLRFLQLCGGTSLAAEKERCHAVSHGRGRSFARTMGD